MSEEESKKSANRDYSREFDKGRDSEKSSYEKLHDPGNIPSIKEGYQPIVDITSTPPDGGSGVPDKDKDK